MSDGDDRRGGDPLAHDSPPARREPRPDGGQNEGGGGLLGFLREVVSSALMVLAVAAILFAVSGVWPPMVAVKSESMQPHLHRGDLVFVMDENRLPPNAAIEGTGVVPYRDGREADYRKLGDYGDVIVYRPDGSTRRDPIIHRARFWVSEGENWYPKANESYVEADSCAELANCPAPNDGFITKGDNPRTNQQYDQATGMSKPVKPSWVRGTAEFRLPWLGWIRLTWSELQRGAVAAGGAAVLLAGAAGRRRRPA